MCKEFQVNSKEEHLQISEGFLEEQREAKRTGKGWPGKVEGIIVLVNSEKCWT